MFSPPRLLGEGLHENYWQLLLIKKKGGAVFNLWSLGWTHAADLSELHP